MAGEIELACLAAVGARGSGAGDGGLTRDGLILREGQALICESQDPAARYSDLGVPPEPPAAVPPAPEPVPATPAPQTPAAPVADAAPPGRWNVHQLESLVNERGREFPDRAEEWTSYLYSLRAYASSDGSLPSSFDALIAETFGELV